MNSELSAAEKAELRRQKILAKKKTRMAYAAGNQSSLPSTVPAQPLPILAEENAQQSNDTHPQQPETVRLLTSTISNSEPGALPHYPTPPLLDSLSALNSVPNFRSTAQKPTNFISTPVKRSLFAICGIIFALLNYKQVIPLWRISAVESFFFLELGLSFSLITHLLRKLIYRNPNPAGTFGQPFPLRMLGLATRSMRYQEIAQQFMIDFCVYMLSFLLTWDIITRY